MAKRPIRQIVILAILGAIIGLGTLITYYTDLLWFQTLNYSAVFWTMRIAQFWSAVMFAVLAAAVVVTNILIAGRFTRHALLVGPSPFEGADGEVMPGERFLKSKAGYLIAAIVLVLIMATLGASRWPLLLRFTHSQMFGVVDPIFGNDIGFYVFALPFYEFVLNFLNGAVIVSVLAVALIYIGGGGIRIQEGIQVMPRPLGHLSGLGALYVLLMAGNYIVKMYGLLFSQNSWGFGANYVDVNVNLWAYRFLALMFLGAAVMLAINIRRRSRRLLLMTAGVLVGGAIVVSAVPGAVVQKLIVEPSELAKEAPYIAYNIEATRAGFDLNRIEERPFEAAEDLTREDIERNPLTIGNIRVWDERPLIQTYQQLQEIRPYYVFHDVDVDRYTVDGEYRQVMLAGRELAIDRLPAQARNWVNERLQYTHGYGIAMSPVNDVTPEGLPNMLVKDIPPVSHTGLEITRPEIYYGERTHAYVVVKTGMEEFDYPRRDENQFTTYQGTGGVPFNGFFNRLAFTVRFTDINLLLSTYMRHDSRIMFRRTIIDRAREIAPYLIYDRDPYIVVHEGRLLWVIDAYTATDMYPYSTQSGRSRTNYIRNSVKVVVDAYHGSIEFYRIDKKDPIINAYAEIFPGLFRPIEEMAAELRAHLRYPRELFRFQVMLYQTYHMKDVQVYYNQEDLWQIPNEIYKDRAQIMEPYYITMKLPDEDREEFLLMIPFTPAKKDNMISWLAARCDVENYGDLIVYRLPKDKLIYGPMQLEARIDQQTEISSQLTLWGQRGSEVIRGNLLAIPIGSSFIYVEPVYLQARQEPEPQEIPMEGEPQRRRVREELSTAIPELKQVIAIHGNRIVMRATLGKALDALFGDAPSVPPDVAAADDRPSSIAETFGLTAAGLADAAAEMFESVKESLRGWDWASAGERMEALERTITELQERLAKQQ